MPFAVILIGAILVIAAFNNTHGQLASELTTDLPGYFKWGVALAAILGLGFIPGLKTPSRWLLALVLLVIFLHNYSAILAGFSSFAGSGGTASGSASPTPSAALTASAGQSTDPATAPEIAGDAGSGASGSTPAASAGSQIASAASQIASINPANPSSYIGAIESGFSGAASLFGA